MENLQSVGVIMIRLESPLPPFFSGQYKFRCFDCDSSGDFELQCSHSGWILHKKLNMYFSFGETVSKV